VIWSHGTLPVARTSGLEIVPPLLRLDEA